MRVWCLFIRIVLLSLTGNTTTQLAAGTKLDKLISEHETTQPGRGDNLIRPRPRAEILQPLQNMMYFTCLDSDFLDG